MSQAAPPKTVVFEFPEDATLEDMQDQIIHETLQRLGGNVTRAARALMISTRTIQRWRKRYAAKVARRRIEEM